MGEQRVEVTQADRDLAHEIMHHVRGYAVRLPYDRHWLIDLVARHRLAATPKQPAEPAKSPAEVGREALIAVLGWLRSAPLESGYCCCGSAVSAHGMGDGHSPVDELSYSAGQLEERILAALAAPHREPEGWEAAWTAGRDAALAECASYARSSKHLVHPLFVPAIESISHTLTPPDSLPAAPGIDERGGE